MTEKSFNSRRREARYFFTQVSLLTKATILFQKITRLTVLTIDCPCSHSEQLLLGVILILSM